MARTEPSVTAVVVNYNGAHLLDACLSTLLAQTHAPHEVILVDNGSADASVPMVRERYPGVTVVECGTNLGYAEGSNVGVRRASGEFVALVNSDARLAPDCLERLADALSGDPRLAAVQGKVLRADPPPTIDSIGSQLTPTGFLFHVGDGRPDGPVASAAIFTTRGVCMMVRRDGYVDLGGFDPDFFLYFEETDFCWRAWLAGRAVALVPSSVTHHLGSATAKTLERPFVEFHAFKNPICSILKNASPATLAFMVPLHLAMTLLILAGFLARRRPRLAGAVARAIAWNGANLRRTLRKRAVVQSRLRRVRDGTVFATCLERPGPAYYWRRFRGALDRFPPRGGLTSP